MLVIASDHAGYPLKEFLKKHLADRGLPCLDLGADNKFSCDYPVFGRKAAEMVAAHPGARGIVICGTGVGISIAANKVKGIRCVVCTETCSALLARQHNNANMLALGARVVGEEQARCIADAFLDATFDGGERHERRVALLDGM